MATHQMRIIVEESTWEKLNKEKRAGETFDDVVNRLLDLKEASIK